MFKPLIIDSHKNVLVAMSGGVDSSVAAALLKEQGYNVIGATMQIWEPKNDFGGCCSLSAVNDAKRVADILGIKHYVLNFRKEFNKLVIDNFIEEYKNGRTPNPCIRCNQFLKFDLLLKKAKELGADFIATGHYARIISNKLLKGLDQTKDQSYVLYTMTQKSLAHTLFPLGDLTKKDVRKLALIFKLPVAEKKESQEICFVEDNNYSNFIKEKFPKIEKPGLIIDKTGKAVGEHNGIIHYTVGQRKGIGAHKGTPKYVVEINNKNNSIIIGDQKDLLKTELTAENVSFISGKFPTDPINLSAKIRYNSKETEAVLYPESKNKAKIIFKSPQRAVTPGQSVVFYNREEVLGGGIIC
ncbi:MAG: tRNA-specific 2-thiouridylase [Candidatus Saganbacteria bacterium]|uniref:tRNA-specific 2-thiouridylase MnmA n=1 Tax=Candidatus Saganbacteria bacterium TaxID=2575572 RepID=A0A833L0F7_UNCSA|nr:MAG: tRNA-specific 2-thiouridylase [Candidatus Saganbacteria bacterium]